MPSYPQVTLSTLEALYRLGKNICAEIEKFQPDIVIGLAHSGWLPVVVAQTLWAETRSAPFPPAMRTNIGQEKNDIYRARYGENHPAFCCLECCDRGGRLGHYLAWAAEQGTWLKTLRKQIKAVYPSEPKRILVVDDLFGGHRSGFAALSILDALYPQAEIYMYAGHNDLTDNFVTGWLTEFIPSLAKEITDKGVDTSKVRFGSSWHEILKPLITGTEDITLDSLDWQFITHESAAVKAVAEYVSAEVALSAPQWAKELACDYALQRLRNEIKDDEIVEPPEDQDHLFSITSLSLRNEDRLTAKAWRQGGVTSADIAQIYGDDPEKIKEGLREVKVARTWHTHGRKPNEIYFPIESLETWINAYFPSELPDHAKPKTLIPGFAEFLPGEVWAGAYPISNRGMDVELFKDILGKNISHFIDLTIPAEAHRKISYRRKLRHISHAMNKRVEMEYFPLPFRTAPSRLQVRHALKYIARTLKQGKRVYIHAGHNLEGRAPLLLACLLIERGCSPKKAIAKVDAFWMKTLYFLIRSPLSKEQRQFILDWK